jgi:lactate dehydrogenase-like 2-hydroxyacid dehydrogenase
MYAATPHSVQFKPQIAAACKRFEGLELVQIMSAGYDWLDLDVIPTRGVSVCNTSSMDHAIAEFVDPSTPSLLLNRAASV